METIKVNMSPNPLDVQTIHASQNDGEARQWEFELHNNGELIDTSDVKEQLVFKAYKGGTEQLLPENGSVPTTSPFKGDIKYPQGLLTDQEFTYRQSPTESDGLAKITDIKGNTLVWNQLVQNGNFADTSLWRTYASTGFSVSNNVGSFTVTGATGAIYQTNTPTYVSGHKYLVIADFYVSQQSNISVEVSGTRGQAVSANANTWYRYSDIVTPSAQGNFSLTCSQASVQVKNVMCFDITKMGLDITDPSDFTSLFNLPYYSYNQGSLLSFNGNGIKTVGKNRFNKDTVTLNSRIAENGQIYSSSASDLTDYIDVGAYDSVNFSWDYSSLSSSDSRAYVKFDAGKNVVGFATYSPTSKSVSIDTSSCFYLRITLDKGMNDIQVENGQKTSYEPYTSSTLSLPISTYFPTGMKSAGTAYDELTESKAITRVGAIVLDGTQTPRLTGITANQVFSFDGLLNTAPCKTVNVNMIGTYGLGVSYSSTSYTDNRFAFSTVATPLLIYPSGKFADVDALKTYLTSNPVTINYELATPTETPITTASLITENAEIPLSNEDGVLIGKCTEQLSENPGFFDAKIKLSDSDGECYSNKIQLHVERKPS